MKFTPDSLPDLSGRVFFVTGGTSGIGYHTVLHLAAQNAKVYIGARSESKAAISINKIHQIFPSAELYVIKIDLSDLSSVREAIHEFLSKETSLHCLINNAGIAATPFEITKDGYEAQFQTNYLSHWLLTYHFLPILRSTAKQSHKGIVRIVNVSSDGHKYFSPSCGIDFVDLDRPAESGSVWTRYGQSKLANVLHSNFLNKKYGPDIALKEKRDDELWIMSVHPGSVKTDLLTKAGGLGAVLRILQPFLTAVGAYITPDQGSFTALFAAVSSEIKREDSGAYIVPFGKHGSASKSANDTKLAQKLWDWTEHKMRDAKLI